MISDQLREALTCSTTSLCAPYCSGSGLAAYEADVNAEEAVRKLAKLPALKRVTFVVQTQVGVMHRAGIAGQGRFGVACCLRSCSYIAGCSPGGSADQQHTSLCGCVASVHQGWEERIAAACAARLTTTFSDA
jgi:hypothetical protein